MQDKTTSLYDNHNRITLRGIYEDCREEIKIGLKEITDKQDNKRVISYKEFYKIVSLYLSKVFDNLINGYSFRLYNHFGVLRVVKTYMIRYNARTYSFKRVNGKIIREVKKLENKNGYWYFIFWDTGKKYRHYRFKADIKYKRQYMEKVNNGFDYLDISLDKYGRKASDTYIEKIL